MGEGVNPTMEISTTTRYDSVLRPSLAERIAESLSTLPETMPFLHQNYLLLLLTMTTLHHQPMHVPNVDDDGA